MEGRGGGWGIRRDPRFLARNRRGQNPAVWLVAGALGEVLPHGDKEQPLITGVVHGRVIELERELGLPDGETITVTTNE